MPAVTAIPRINRVRAASCAFELTAVFDVVTGRQLLLGGHPLPDVVHHAGQVSPRHVCHDHHFALYILPANGVGATVLTPNEN
jgi:hypothetical protein